jgi:hypothetical protein
MYGALFYIGSAAFSLQATTVPFFLLFLRIAVYFLAWKISIKCCSIQRRRKNLF